MALFPDASFEVHLPGGRVTAGSLVDGELAVTAREPIPRAERIQCVFYTRAWATYGSGKNSSTMYRDLYRRALEIAVPGHHLAAGRHRLPFQLDIPAWLPPAFSGQRCGVSSEIEARVDVDWAIDPTQKVSPIVTLTPRTGTREPLATRSPPGFHEQLVLEVTLTSRTLVVGEPIVGVIALRGGFEARFDRIELSYGSFARIVMGRNDLRQCAAPTVVNIPADSLRTGASIPFVLPSPPGNLPTLRNNFIDHDAFLVVRAKFQWSSDPAFDIRLEVLPAGSTLLGEARIAEVGGERLARLGAVMAHGSGLRQARVPALVEGTRGFVATRLTDAPRAALLGIDVDFTFPDVELGIEFRKRDFFDSGSHWQLTPELSEYRLLSEPVSPLAQAFFDVLLRDIAGFTDLRFSDHHLGFHLILPDDDEARMVSLARATATRAAAIDLAIRQLPFVPALAAARPAWEATAVEQNALLVPTGPALHGIVLRARVTGGEERMIIAAVHTVKLADRPPTCRVDLRLDQAPLPLAARAALEDESLPPTSEQLRAVRAVFPSGSVLSDGAAATLEGAAWPGDPRALLPALEAFLGWVLETRGERRADAPYR